MSNPTPITPEQIEYLCRLAAIQLAPEEVSKLKGDLGRILEYMKLLEDVDTGGAEPLVQPAQLAGGLREDVPGTGSDPADALRGAPKSCDGYFAVPPVVKRAPKSAPADGRGGQAGS
ncbi:Asp-tRNA(Asn)/Glu-tRNA(Gln) amidotransferase subunit GatC [Candidatus Eisenbacteria bacterium]|uniref:Aspartyl/glutamyl-tRNA(Asn/Gln) amidotransferase subunit C n=1 Tax=Eiseniibacteriota bacterium TaxID=2212470 RepID=A0ABV6YJQ2_UNCEI